ncbi:hypothetical protein [Streptomyces sp. 7-21]|uniref:hypothetical protein n=1 Tax=Streptomyces sp. 7-21 TaxID=2802283 RepID=UPI00191F3183|nr:hypothetical protein [Streptomyces sp. 7-21]MBL1068619.1 hypothetical protein [Streptomyces sp. 7-21]
MGSLRTPVGPLPSSIYWRRRAVVIGLAALLVLLLVWVFNLGGGGGDEEPAGRDDNSAGDGPAESITPGPSPSESVIDERPGGREESGDDEEDDDASGGSDDASGAGGDGDEDGDGSPGDDGRNGSGDGAGGSGSAGGTTGDYGDPAGLPGCGPDDVELSLRSDRNDYPIGEHPLLRLTVSNVSGSDCQVDFGTRTLTLTIANAQDERVWSSTACPEDPGSIPAAVPAGGSVQHTIEWNRRHTPSGCEGQGSPAAAGTYLVEAELGDLPVAQTSFRLDQD